MEATSAGEATDPAKAVADEKDGTTEQAEPTEPTEKGDKVEKGQDSDEEAAEEAASETKSVEFTWVRQKIFDRHAVLVFLEMMKSEGVATVQHVTRSTKVKKKPGPLNTIELQKLASKKLHFSACKTMDVAEKLYNKGLISYPRTETNFFPPSYDLMDIVKALAPSRGRQ